MESKGDACLPIDGVEVTHGDSKQQKRRPRHFAAALAVIRVLEGLRGWIAVVQARFIMPLVWGIEACSKSPQLGDENEAICHESIE